MTSVLSNPVVYYRYFDGAKEIHRSSVNRHFQTIAGISGDDPIFWKSYTTELIKTMVYGCDIIDETRLYACIPKYFHMQACLCLSCGNYERETVTGADNFSSNVFCDCHSQENIDREERIEDYLDMVYEEHLWYDEIDDPHESEIYQTTQYNEDDYFEDEYDYE